MIAAEFHELFSKGHHTEVCLNLKGANVDQAVHFLMQVCTNRLHKVEELLVEGGKILDLSSEATGEETYYLLSVTIKEKEGLTQIMVGAVSDKPYGLQGFLYEVVSDLRSHVRNLEGVKEVSVIREERSSSFYIGGDAIFVRSPFSIGDIPTSHKGQNARNNFENEWEQQKLGDLEGNTKRGFPESSDRTLKTS